MVWTVENDFDVGLFNLNRKAVGGVVPIWVLKVIRIKGEINSIQCHSTNEGFNYIFTPR